METSGPHDEQGKAAGDLSGPGADPPDNVLHFPRDWFGPPEHLVPFGPRAAQAALTTGSDRTPISADDFWSESSAAIHDVLKAPSPDQAVTARRGEFAARAQLSTFARLRLRTRTRLSLAATVLAAASAAVFLPELGSGPTIGVGRAPRTDSVVLDASASGLISALAHAKASALNLAHLRAGPPRQGAHGHRTPRRGPASPSAGSTSDASGPASHSAPVHGIPVSTQTDAVSAGSGGASAGSGSSTGGSSQPAAVASSASSPSSPPAGPTGPGAAFGPGHLG